MLVVLLLFYHIGFMVAPRNLFAAHNLSYRWWTTWDNTGASFPLET